MLKVGQTHMICDESNYEVMKRSIRKKKKKFGFDF